MVNTKKYFNDEALTTRGDLSTNSVYEAKLGLLAAFDTLNNAVTKTLEEFYGSQSKQKMHVEISNVLIEKLERPNADGDTHDVNLDITICREDGSVVDTL